MVFRVTGSVICPHLRFDATYSCLHLLNVIGVQPVLVQHVVHEAVGDVAQEVLEQGRGDRDGDLVEGDGLASAELGLELPGDAGVRRLAEDVHGEGAVVVEDGEEVQDRARQGVVLAEDWEGNAEQPERRRSCMVNPFIPVPRTSQVDSLL